MTVPTRWALAWVGVGLVCCALAAVDRRWVLVALVLDVVVVAAVLLQGRMHRRREVRAAWHWHGQPQVGQSAALELHVDNPGPRPLHLHLRQDWPADVFADRNEWLTAVAPRQRVVFPVEATPTRRGRLVLPPLEADVTAPFSLAASRRRIDAGGAVTVFPNLSGIRTYETLRRSRALRSAGFHQQRTIGAGREFDQMREYLPGDDYRDINWKATARSGEPLTNQYRVERSRDVVICVDGGRMMGNPVGNGTVLDRCVDAALLLTHAGHDQGDRVGLVTFRDRVDTVIRPGTTNRPMILRTLADFDSRPVFPSYLSLVEALRTRQTHRSLVFLLTDLNDPQLAADLVELMPVLVSRHLVVVVSLQDRLFERVASGVVEPGRGAIARVLAARELDQERRERTRQLIKAGVQVLDADAETLSLAVINHYMSVKARQLV